MSTSGDEGAAGHELAAGPQGAVDRHDPRRAGSRRDRPGGALGEGPARRGRRGVHDRRGAPRANPSDVLICRNAGRARAGALIGTSSLRRRAQLLAAFPGLEVVDLRGNVDTRLRKVGRRGGRRRGAGRRRAARLGLEPRNPAAAPRDDGAGAGPGLPRGADARRRRDTIGAVAPLDHAPATGRSMPSVADVAARRRLRAAPRRARDGRRRGRSRCAVIATPDGTGAAGRDRGRDPRGRRRGGGQGADRQGAERILTTEADERRVRTRRAGLARGGPSLVTRPADQSARSSTTSTNAAPGRSSPPRSRSCRRARPRSPQRCATSRPAGSRGSR